MRPWPLFILAVPTVMLVNAQSSANPWVDTSTAAALPVEVATIELIFGTWSANGIVDLPLPTIVTTTVFETITTVVSESYQSIGPTSGLDMSTTGEAPSSIATPPSFPLSESVSSTDSVLSMIPSDSSAWTGTFSTTSSPSPVQDSYTEWTSLVTSNPNFDPGTAMPVTSVNTLGSATSTTVVTIDVTSTVTVTSAVHTMWPPVPSELMTSGSDMSTTDGANATRCDKGISGAMATWAGQTSANKCFTPNSTSSVNDSSIMNATIWFNGSDPPLWQTNTSTGNWTWTSAIRSATFATVETSAVLDSTVFSTGSPVLRGHSRMLPVYMAWIGLASVVMG